MITSEIRVRFAPSPTGMFHVGGARSALYNWVIARQGGGRFVLRIEDTDAERNRPEWTDGILQALAAIGIDERDPAFEGPYFQSHNADRHREVAQRLFTEGAAYYCDCTREQTVERTGSEQRGYDGHCSDRALAFEPGRALRFRTPREGVTTVVDLVRGEPAFPNEAMEDFVIARGDGSPLFVLANVVDDVDQRVTHVVRGEEHLSNTPKQQLLWEALGVTPPVWGHLPVIVNEKRQKLSKRRDKVALESYLAEGYLPEAMINYLMLLGWGPKDDVEIRPFAELAELFRLEEVNSSSAFFDVKKLSAINAEYIRALPVEEFVRACEPWLKAPAAPWAEEAFDPAVFAEVAELAQTRITVLGDITKNIDFLFLEEPETDGTAWAKTMGETAAPLLADVRKRLVETAWETEALKEAVTEVGTAYGLKLGKAQAPVRVAVTGRTVGLPLFESLQVLGRERVLARIDAALAKLA
ncbi:glutamate--tRNA ligase [Kitasatospora sp. NPDC002227]|uniref:glutamate--tRNA ligase n=1 Tax=Kitasatospora sp. NPDC002227 TaxID=3154773 RepID=UPI00331CEDB2